nr:dehydrodolichyl diphosphate synthase 2-like [Ipomoea batatas]
MLSHRLCFSLSPSDLKRSIPISRVPLHPLYVAQVRPFQVALAANNAINGTENGAVRFKESGEASDEEASLPAGLRQDLMPNHVAVIMDGNRRWARTRGLPVASGYEAGVEALRRLVKLCCKWEIRVLTVFAFSLDNWFRPKVEIDFLMGLFENGLNNLLEEFASLPSSSLCFERSFFLKTSFNAAFVSFLDAAFPFAFFIVQRKLPIQVQQSWIRSS